MKLYQVPNNTLVRVLKEESVPPGATPLPEGTIVKFHHIDGMYSLCTKDEEVVHLKAWTEVEVVNDF